MDEPNVAASRYSRLWLVGLLALTAIVTGGALFAKYQLEGVRGVLLDNARTRIGARLQVKDIDAFGLRGLRAEGVRFTYPNAPGGELEVDAPEALIYIDLLDLLSGKVSVEHIRLDGASFHIRREPGEPWVQPVAGLPGGPSAISSTGIPFRLTGSGCTLSADNVVNNTRLEMTGVDFDISRLTGSPTITGTVSGTLENDDDKAFALDIQYASPKDFDFRVRCAKLSADDVNIFLPATRRMIRTGTASPTARLTGNENGTISISLESAFEDIQVRNQPEYLPPATGTFSAYGSYSPASRTLQLSMANAETQTLSGSVNGEVTFGEGSPNLNLTFTSSRLPVREVLNSLLAGRLERYGEIEYSVDTLEECKLTLTGSTEEPIIKASAAADGGSLAFTPADSKYPKGEVRLGHFEVAWDSETREPSGTIAILDGSIAHKRTDLEADNLSGRVAMQGGEIQVDPLKASFMGQPLMVTGSYNVEEQKGEAAVSGSLDRIEKTKLAGYIRNAELAGSGSVNANLRLSRDSVKFDADVDATQTEIGYRWWFLKPVGIGANGKIEGTLKLNRSITCTIDALIAGTEVSATTDLVYNGSKWQLRDVNATSDSVDVVSVGKCLPLPYTITGGKGTKGSYVWHRDEAKPDETRSQFACDIDQIGLQADTSDQPILCKVVHLEGGMVSGSEETGELTVVMDQGQTPPLRGSKWFAPLERDLEKFPPVDRRWTFNLKAKTLEVPPWTGIDFVGDGFGDLTEFGLSHYSAKVEEGRVSGSYLNHRNENSFESEAAWENVPAKYLMDTLDLAHVFRGNMSGKVSYSQDRDDPGTLEGKGYFTMGDGQFSADYLLSMLEQQSDSAGVSSLPPSLRFSSLETDVEFEKDVVRTPRIELTSDAIRLKAQGQFVTDGDMDYDIQIAVTPDAAERIPLLAENFNVQGHRLAQQDIDLAFKLTGPALKPVSSLEETPPVHVTLVSGALEAANEAIRVIDAPRKILVDLLKIGGGIVGARKAAPSGSPN